MMAFSAIAGKRYFNAWCINKKTPVTQFFKDMEKKGKCGRTSGEHDPVFSGKERERLGLLVAD